MKITEINGYEVSCRLPEPQGNSTGYFDSRSSLIVSITLEDGATGWGETWQSPAAAAGFVREVLAPSLIGKDSSAPARLWRKMMEFVGYDRRGASIMAVSAVDMAIWDASAKSASVPLSQLMGGALRDRVRPYASGPFLKPGTDQYRDFSRDAERYLRAGFTAIKMRMGTKPEADGRVARAMRELVGPDVYLMADLNEGFTAKAAERIAVAMADSNLLWIEEPILPDDLAGYKRLIASLPMPLAGGEALCGLGAFRDFISAGALDIVQPDLAICGGITEALRIAALADAFDVAVIPHVWGTGINYYASLQFVSILPSKRGAGLDFPLYEYDYSPNPLRSAFGDIALEKDGMIPIPEKPGIGIDVRRELFAEFIRHSWRVA